jgi:hypothetical protein
MGGRGRYDPTFREGLLYQILALVGIFLLPIGWVLSIVGGLIYILCKPTDFKERASKIAYLIGIITAAPLFITAQHCVTVFQSIKGFISALSYRKRKKKTSNRGRTTTSSQDTAHLEDAELLNSEAEPAGPDSPPPGQPKSYRYHDLKGTDEFRLLVIAPGSFDDPLQGDIVTTDFSILRQIAYDALSYTWADENGDAERSQEFLCENDNSIIKITKNCEAAMRRLRLSDRKRWMWIDAICINQDSDAERTYQVSLMSKIYTSASHVIVYTGEGTFKTDMLFDWLNGLKTADLDILSSWDFDNLAVGVTTSLERFWNMGKESLLTLVPRTRSDKKKIKISESELLDLVREYFSRRWFTRVWVLQEVALPDVRNTSVVCGSRTISAIRALHALSLLYQESSASIIRIFVLLRKRVKTIARSHLLDVLIETRNRESGDPRDKIFGVLSISNLLDRGKFQSLEPDYGLTKREVYMHYSQLFIEDHGPGFFLSLIKSPPELEGLPSWAADWTVPWPNYKAVSGKDFAAASRSVGDKDAGVEDNIGLFIAGPDGCTLLAVQRPLILCGYFTRNGHLDDQAETCIERVGSLALGEVLIEMYPGLAALLEVKDQLYKFIQICPHALSEQGVKELVGRWSSVVVDGQGPRDQNDQDNGTLGYLGAEELFKIR